jgi:hypothetical protein
MTWQTKVMRVTKVTRLKKEDSHLCACTLASKPVLQAKVQSGQMTLQKKVNAVTKVTRLKGR